VAEDAERDLTKYFHAVWARDHVGESFTATISGVTNFGVFLALPNGVEGLMHVSQLEDDYYLFLEDQLMLMGKSTRKRYRMGDRVEVKILASNPVNRQIDLLPAHMELPEADPDEVAERAAQATRPGRPPKTPLKSPLAASGAPGKAAGASAPSRGRKKAAAPARQAQPSAAASAGRSSSKGARKGPQKASEKAPAKAAAKEAAAPSRKAVPSKKAPAGKATGPGAAQGVPAPVEAARVDRQASKEGGRRPYPAGGEAAPRVVSGRGGVLDGRAESWSGAAAQATQAGVRLMPGPVARR
jgi:predicted RNA-binding protein with RPS1 domain